MSLAIRASALQAIESALQHLYVFPDLTGFEWFGIPQVTALTASSHANDIRGYLTEAVAICLYQNLYTAGLATAYREPARYEQNNRHGGFVQAILNANGTRIAWSYMRVVRFTEAVVVSTCGDVAIHTHRASSLLRNRDGGRIPVSGDFTIPSIVKVGTKSWTLTASPGFIVMIGRREPNAHLGALHRVYWNLNSVSAADFVSRTTHHLNCLRVPFRLKVLTEPRAYDHRCDTAIVYLNLRNTKAQQAIAAIHGETSHYLRNKSPALTYRIAPGLAIAEDPGQGMSFGLHRCRLIAEACVQATESGFAASRDLLLRVDRVFADNGIDLRRPHYYRAGDDAYAAELEQALRATQRREPVSPLSTPNFAPVASWLATATTIGRQLAAEAFWSKGRCQWMGREGLSSGQTVFRTISDTLYNGVSGIAHFLTELASRTHHDELAATALGAVRQALFTSSSERIGLYDGSLGTAMVAIRAARVLGDSSLVDQAASLARQLAARTHEQSPDLLNGLAGQILGFLTLADLVPDELFRSRALELGYLLVERAEHTAVGSSWPHRMIESKGNLTGFSHGAAGIALALGELWRNTGDRMFIETAVDAGAYEDSVFSGKHSNWPDYRLSRVATQSPKYSNFWCHGAPGIVLSRLRLSFLMGLEQLPPNLQVAVDAVRQAVEANLNWCGTNLSLCHGLGGNTEILWEASRWGNALADWQQRAAESAYACWRIGAGAIPHSSKQAWPGDIGDNPSLFLGRAGIGYAYLRLHDPSIPSILAIDPQQW